MADLAALDCSTFLDGDLDPTFANIGGRRAVGERVLRGWLTSPGDVHYDLSRGEDIRLWLNAGMTAADTLTLQNRLRMDALKDEGVLDCTVVITRNFAEQTLTIAAEVEDEVGTYPLTLAIDLVTAEILEAFIT